MVPVRLITDRFVMRKLSRQDVSPIAEAVVASLPELQRWLPWAHSMYGREDAVTFVRDSQQSWKDGRAFDYAIKDPQTPDIHLGNCSIWHVSKVGKVGEIGYWIRSDRTSQGIATEATARLVRLGFEELGLHKINLRIAAGNLASEKVADKLGFTEEGVLREELQLRGRWVDHTLYSLLEREWER